MFIPVSHLVGAAMARVLYTAFGRRLLFLWILGLFAFTTSSTPSDHRPRRHGSTPDVAHFLCAGGQLLHHPNFALWPDLSTPADIGIHTGLGVGIAGWLASFLCTSLALYSRSAGLSPLEHLRYVNALALLLAVTYPTVLYVQRMRRFATAGEAS